MEKAADDKAERVLSMYSRLKQGKTIDKAIEGNRYGVTQRTIQRDISDIQCFLQTQGYETGEVQEIIYDRRAGGYRLETKIKRNLEAKEILTVCKVLLGSHALVKEEMFLIINKLTDACNDGEGKKRLRRYLENGICYYFDLYHRRGLPDRIWELENAIKEQRYVKICYEKMEDPIRAILKVKPAGVVFSDSYFYLAAYIEDTAGEKDSQNPDDLPPAIYRLDRLEDIEVLDERFFAPYMGGVSKERIMEFLGKIRIMERAGDNAREGQG